jgi:hypothetical protein
VSWLFHPSHASTLFLILPDRVQRLKDARTEADKEIEAYRKVKEQEFTAFQSSVSPISYSLRPDT